MHATAFHYLPPGLYTFFFSLSQASFEFWAFESTIPGVSKFATMSVPIFLLWLVSIPLPLVLSDPIANPAAPASSSGFFINCGSTEDVEIGQLKYVADGSFISPENTKTASIDYPNLLPILSTLRYIPDRTTKQKCYYFPVAKGVKHVVKAIFYYGRFDGGNSPPVFDLIIEGTKWGTVNTTEDFFKGQASFYEIIIAAHDEKLSVCLAYNDKTASSPFISALQVQPLFDSCYNTTDFNKFALMTVARHSFEHVGELIGFPDDKFDRHWQPFQDGNPVVLSHSNVTSSEFWNNPPQKAFQFAITTSRGKTLQVMWPPFSLPRSRYYMALYFQDNRTPSPYSWRVFDVDVNGVKFYRNLNVTSDGTMIYSDYWPLSGQTTLTLTPRIDIPVGPLINAAELLQLVTLEQRTALSDATVMNDLLGSIQQLPADWSGDPCKPIDHAWTGVSCRHMVNTRIVSLNLTNLQLSGKLPQSLSGLSALHHLWLGGNSLSGPLPDFGQLQSLETLHLENNKFEGPIPESLGKLPNLREVFLQNNNFTGNIPASLLNRRAIFVQF